MSFIDKVYCFLGWHSLEFLRHTKTKTAWVCEFCDKKVYKDRADTKKLKNNKKSKK